MNAVRRIRQFFLFPSGLALVLWSALVVSPIAASAQEAAFPSKPIQIIVPFAPGGSLDVGTRVLTDALSKELKVPVVVENRAGAGGLLGATAFFNAKPDGYTLLAASPAAIIANVQLSKNPTFDPRKDFIPLGLVGISPICMSVRKDSPFKTFNDFSQFAKKNPGKLIAGFSSPGGETHIMLLSILREAKIECKVVPYTTSGERLAAELGGHIDWGTSSLVSQLPHLKSGDTRTLLLTHRSPEAPGVPAGPELGLEDVSVDLWLGLFAHGKTPKPVADKLAAALKTTLADAKVKEALNKAGYIPEYKASQDFAKVISKDWNIFDSVLKESGLQTK